MPPGSLTSVRDTRAGLINGRQLCTKCELTIIETLSSEVRYIRPHDTPISHNAIHRHLLSERKGEESYLQKNKTLRMFINHPIYYSIEERQLGANQSEEAFENNVL